MNCLHILMRFQVYSETKLTLKYINFVNTFKYLIYFQMSEKSRYV